MSSTTVLLIAVPTLVVLAGLVLFAAARRRDTGAAVGQLSHETRTRDRGVVAPTEEESAPPTTGREIERMAALERRGGVIEKVDTDRAPVPWVPPDAETIGVSRRQFFNRGLVALMGLGITAFSGASVVFLWPSVKGGFGSKIKVGKISDIQAKIDEGSGFAYYPEGRMWITAYPSASLEKAKAVYSPPELAGMEAGVVALYQKCPHLGCRVPSCVTSQWFECPCHGSQYNQVGEKKGGPAPRGMDRFAMTVDGDSLTVDTATVIPGPPIGTNTTGQEAEGPHCISGGH
ncbi:MAG TPA: Rieske 2Fe-2S domain-containing protein [Acidimicrobiales bacterium]|jgi:cytochrome b6-f complex iron-sulfur subunit